MAVSRPTNPGTLGQLSVRPCRHIHTVYPRCPVCGRTTNLLMDHTESTHGRPMSWYCPEDCLTIRRARKYMKILAHTIDGDLYPVGVMMEDGA